MSSSCPTAEGFRFTEHHPPPEKAFGEISVPSGRMQLLFALSGSMKVFRGRYEVYCDCTDVLFLGADRPESEIGFGYRSRFSFVTVELPSDRDRPLPNRGSAPILTISRDLEIHSHLCALRAGIGRGDRDSAVREIVDRLAVEVFALAKQTAPRGTSEAKLEAVVPVRRFLVENYRDALTLDEIADGVGISKYHLSRMFRNETGKTLWSYIQYLRVSDAMWSLAEEELDLTDLALDLGYSSHSHFTAEFRKAAGRTPSEMRRHLRVMRT